MMFCNTWLLIQVARDNVQVDDVRYAAGVKNILIASERWLNFKAAAQQWLKNYPENAGTKTLEPI